MWGKSGRWFLLLILVVVLAIQLVPYGRNHENPVVRKEPIWNSPQTRDLTVRSCFDCHSNETVWPWYSNIAPASWIIQRDVDKGRRKVNFSEWDRPQKEAHESGKKLQYGEMPPWYYPWAQLSTAERDSLARGLQSMVGQNGRVEKHGEEAEED